MNLKILYFVIQFQIVFEICYAVWIAKRNPMNITKVDEKNDHKPLTAIVLMARGQAKHNEPVQYAPVSVKLNCMDKLVKENVTSTPLIHYYNTYINMDLSKTESPVEILSVVNFTQQQGNIDDVKHFPRMKTLTKVKNKKVKEIEELKVKFIEQKTTTARGILYNHNEDLSNQLIMSVESGKQILKSKMELNVGQGYNLAKSYKVVY